MAVGSSGPDSGQLTLFDGRRRRPVDIDVECDLQDLARELVDEWLPYLECDHCGRVDYCKYTEPHPHRANRHLDIQCGIAKKALTSFLVYTFDVFRSATTQDQRQAYLDGAYYFTNFVYNAELRIANFLDDDIMRWWGQGAPLNVGQIVWLRDDLNGLARSLRNLPRFNARQTVILVEGPSEKLFLERMRESGLATFLFFEVESYNGRNNRQPGRLQMLLEKYERDNYRVCIQGDADGRGNQTEALSRNKVPPERMFFFEWDFETSWPAKLLHEALVGLDLISLTSQDEFLLAHAQHEGKVSTFLEHFAGIMLSSGEKIELAMKVAQLLSRGYSWWADQEFMSSELGRFLEFVRVGRRSDEEDHE